MIDLDCINFNSMPSVDIKDRSRLPELSGVYFLSEGNGIELLYIGSSANIKSRWRRHEILYRLDHNKDYRVSYLLAQTGGLKALESSFISKHLPKMNSAIYPNLMWAAGFYGSAPKLELLRERQSKRRW